MIYNVRTKQWALLCSLLLSAVQASAQYAWQDDAEPGWLDLGREVTYKVEAQGSLSHGTTPLWLNANKYGLSSLDESNGYVRGQIIRPLNNDSARRWGVGYGIDVAIPVNYTSKVVVQQAFVEGRWLHGVFTVGARQYDMELKDQRLSSGAQTLGINARPVPQVRLALPRYYTLPFLGRWLHIKGHVAYGMFTDDNWQTGFTSRQSRYTDHALYHSKAGYLMVGNTDGFYPLSLELGLEMASQFGGTSHVPGPQGQMQTISGGRGLKSFWNVLIPGGADATDGQYTNVEGNHLGSYVARINYDSESWSAALYADHFFEDHSQMFLIDYNGYGRGEEWNVKKDNRYFMYALKDIMLGAEFKLKYGTWLRGLVVEYIHTKYQSGPYNHDRTANIPDHVAGQDDYYNHSFYTGWQHWGQVMGNPLYRSPIYNTDGRIYVKDNRFVAYHLGVEGQPLERLGYRLLATYQTGYGTYSEPYTGKRHNTSLMLEGSYHFDKGWTVTGAVGIDRGSILGDNHGFQLTVCKKGVFNL